MSFKIIEFKTTNEVAIVSKNWLELKTGTKEDVFGFWPPFWKNRVKLEKAIKKGELPNKATWSKFLVRVLHSCESYDDAREKLPRAEVESDLHSSKEVGTRMRKRRLSNSSENDGDSSDSKKSVTPKKPAARGRRPKRPVNELIQPPQPSMPRLSYLNQNQNWISDPPSILPSMTNLFELTGPGLPAVNSAATTPKTGEIGPTTPRNVFPLHGNTQDYNPYRNAGPSSSYFQTEAASFQEGHGYAYMHNGPMLNFKQLHSNTGSAPTRIFEDGVSSKQTVQHLEPPIRFGAHVVGAEQQRDNSGIRTTPSNYSESNEFPILNCKAEEPLRGQCYASGAFAPEEQNQNNFSSGFSATGPAYSISSENGFQQLVFHKLAYLSAAVNNLTEMVSLLLKSKRNDDSLPFGSEQNDTLLQNLPLASELNLELLNASLEEGPNKRLLIKYLVSVGGDRPSDMTYRVLGILLTNELASKYSYAGKKGKLSFSDFAHLKHSICASVRENPRTANATDKEVEDAIKYWLKKAPTRLKAKVSKPLIRSGEFNATVEDTDGSS